MRAAAGRGVNPLRSLSPAFLYQSSRLLYKPSRLLYPFRVPQGLANGCLTNPRGCYPFRVHARLSSQLLYRIYWGGVPRRACAPRPAGGLTPCAHSLLPSFTNPRGCCTTSQPTSQPGSEVILKFLYDPPPKVGPAQRLVLRAKVGPPRKGWSCAKVGPAQRL